ncbi:hypothetical protein ACQUE3_03380 [Enterococcus casseliflavus]|uniref:hypothetical protein n=1 Tax=Enterococcus casseliflavus TaxID=37734 RepID=UPI003D11E119
MSAIKAGDKIYFQGNQGKVMRVTHDENEPLLEVVLTQKRVAYLKPSQLDLYPFAEQLNENQQIVLEWLKSTWIDRKKNCWFPFEVINSLYYQFDSVWGNHDFKEVEQIEKEKPYIKAYGELTALEQFEVLEVFSRWAQEQEEE